MPPAPLILTRPLPPSLQLYAQQRGLALAAWPLLCTALLPTGRILQQLGAHTTSTPGSTAWVFTSPRAAAAFSAALPYLDASQVPETLYAIGTATAAALPVGSCQAQICPVPQGAILAHYIRSQATVQQVVHWTSPGHRPELAAILTQAGIRYRALHTYFRYSVHTPPPDEASLAQGLLFCSPSAVVASLGWQHYWSQSMRCYGIGPTTGQALRQHYAHHPLSYPSCGLNMPQLIDYVQAQLG